MMAAPAHVSQTWIPHKAAARGRGGVVVAQAHAAAQAGVDILRAGGGAVDAAVATAFALAAAEPWNSGLGGVGFALVHPAQEPRACVVDFGPVSPAALDPAAFPLTGQRGGDLFGWPEVAGDANLHGPLSVCVPSAVAGYGAMHARWGRLPLAELLAPAIALARRGLAMDWYAAVRLLQSATILRRYPESARIYLPGGMPPAPAHPLAFLPLGGLADTLDHLARAGCADFYDGDVAASIASDVSSRGGVLSRADLRGHRVVVRAPLELPWRSAVLQTAGDGTAGPAMVAALQDMEHVPFPERPDGAWTVALARALRRAQAARFGRDGSTSHISVVDAQGGMVALTTTLLSSFGGKVVLPQSGVLMNNALMWFDPRPGRPNAIAPGARPLTNMCPVILRRGDFPMLAAGASGGRKILPAVMQLLHAVLDFGLPAEAAAALPRIDVSDPDMVLADASLPAEIRLALAADAPTGEARDLVTPGLFAAPNLVMIDTDGTRVGIADVASPWSAALAQ